MWVVERNLLCHDDAHGYEVSDVCSAGDNVRLLILLFLIGELDLIFRKKETEKPT
ncbi:hypothetical protein FACS1894195_4500 [Bacteroidia bacterium]|nr:hypothetical protein FACS1894195_4500 [Bacteroidia bacterium]